MPPPIESVRVVAPDTLTEGYSFEAQVDGKIFEVVVVSSQSVAVMMMMK